MGRQHDVRRAREAEHGASYVVAASDPGFCWYCGQAGKIGLDHVPPLAAASWSGPDRWLYPACKVCNIVLTAYPVGCLGLRAEYLLCRLRAVYLMTKAGRRRQFSLRQLVASADGVKAGLASGAIRARCRCGNCDPESKRA